MAESYAKIIATTIIFLSTFIIISGGFFVNTFQVTYNGLNVSHIINDSYTGENVTPVGGLELEPFPVCQFNNNLLFASLDAVSCGASMTGWFMQLVGIKTNVAWLLPFFLAISAVTFYVVLRLIRGGG